MEFEVKSMMKYSNSLKFKEEQKTIIIGVKENQYPSELEPIITKLKEKKDLFKWNDTTVFYPVDTFQTKQFTLVGLGDKENYSLKEMRTLFTTIAKTIDTDVVIDLDSFKSLDSDLHTICEILTETILLSQYEFKGYKTTKKEKAPYEISIYSKENVLDEITKGVINAEGTNHAKDLVNEPRNKMTPSILAQYAVNLAQRLNLEYKIYNKEEIEGLGMGAFLAVNQGSKEEAKLIHLKYRNSDDDKITALIGKGLTYDSGGYSIKPKTGMAGMKTDMGGAATVLGAIEVIARKKLKVNVDIIIAATENLINEEAVVPDDVVVTMSGKTVEILNTDAEGRLTLIDAVTFAKKNDANEIIDVATLTGGVLTALGKEITGAFTNNQELLTRIKQASETTNEMMWELPVDQFREQCRKSDVADYNNSPGRLGHASFGAAIIAEFAEDTPWVHLDIAGTCTSDKGPTGVMVRTLSKIFE